MIGECVAVLVDALLPLRTRVGELARDRGDPSDRNGEGGLTGVAGLGVDCTESAGGGGVRGRVLAEGLCLLASRTLGGADKTMEGKLGCSGVGLADLRSSGSLVTASRAGLSWIATTIAWVLCVILTISKSGSLAER